jgi:uncharacterized protein (DUF983 family)
MNFDPTVNLITWTTGKLYLAVACKNCGWQFPFANASDEQPECPIEIVCIECEASAFYCPKEFERIQAR